MSEIWQSSGAGSSILFMLSVAAVCSGLLLHVVGMATPYWVDYGAPGSPVRIHDGLWLDCINGHCFSIPTGIQGRQFDASRGFSVLGALTGSAAATCLLLGQYGFPNKRPLLRMTALSAAIATVVCLIINIATFVDLIPSKGREYLGWSFALTATSLAVFGLATALTASLVLRDRRTNYSVT